MCGFPEPFLCSILSSCSPLDSIVYTLSPDEPKLGIQINQKSCSYINVYGISSDFFLPPFAWGEFITGTGWRTREKKYHQFYVLRCNHFFKNDFARCECAFDRFCLPISRWNSHWATLSISSEIVVNGSMNEDHLDWLNFGASCCCCCSRETPG